MARILGARVFVLVLSSIAAIVNVRVVLNALGHQGAGAYFAIIAIAQVLLLWDFGLSMGVAMLAAELGCGTFVWRAACKAAFVLLAYGVAISVMAALVSQLLADRVLHIQTTSATLAITLAFGAAVMSLASQPFIRMMEGMGRTGTVLICDGSRAVIVLMGSLLCTAVGWGLPAFAAAWGIANLVPGVAIFLLALPSAGSDQDERHARLGVRALASSGFGYQLATAGNALNASLDQAVVSARLGPEQVVLYQAVARFIQLARAVFGGFWLYFWPRLYRTSTLASRRREYRAVYVVVALSGLAMALAAVVAGPWVTQIWLGASVNLGRVSLAVAGVVVIVYALETMPSAITNSKALQRRKAYLTLSSAVVNLPLSWWLARQVGFYGPLLATSVSYGVIYVLPLHFMAAERLRRSSEQLVSSSAE